jgi:hypothetical protein
MRILETVRSSIVLVPLLLEDIWRLRRVSEPHVHIYLCFVILLDCDAVWCCDRIATFRRTLLPRLQGDVASS